MDRGEGGLLVFSNLKDAFVKKPQFTAKVPDAVLATAGRKLPDGFRYVYDHGGFCKIDCDGLMHISPAKVNLPRIAKPVFAEHEKYSIEDLQQYAYNSQTQIELLPDEHGYYMVNGKQIKAEDFVAAPLTGEKLLDGKLCIVPPPFPEPSAIQVSGNGFSLSIMVQRQPMNSITEIKIASIENSPLSIAYYLDPVEQKMRLSILTSPTSSAKETLACKEIYNAFISGDGRINGVPIPIIDTDKAKAIPAETLRFWHRIVEVEEALGVTFDVSKEIDIQDIKMVDCLHRSVVAKAPFKRFHNDLTLKGIGEKKDINKSADETPIGKEVMFEYTENLTVLLLGIELNLFAVTAVFDCTVSCIDIPQDCEVGEYRLQITHAEGKRMYSSTQFFAEKQEAQKTRDDPMHIEVFQHAKEVEVY